MILELQGPVAFECEVSRCGVVLTMFSLRQWADLISQMSLEPYVLSLVASSSCLPDFMLS